MRKTYTTEQRKEQANKLHKNKYDYSQWAENIKLIDKLTIKCPIHGEFKQTLHHHLQNHGCPKCGKIKYIQSQRDTLNDFVKKAIKKHENKYDYSSVNYINSQTKVDIKCPIHGVFKQTPNKHLLGRNCPKCSQISSRLTTDNFITKSTNIHKNKYDYSLVEYFNTNTKVRIICPKHGEFTQTPASHLRGSGCLKCSHDLTRKTTTQFIDQSNIVHNNKYDYSQVEYINAHTKVKIICPIHGKFKQKPSDHIVNRQGCPRCGRIGKFNHNSIELNKNDDATLYFLNLFNDKENFYKIGITRMPMQKRINLMATYYKVKTIKTIKTTLYKAFLVEQELIRQYQSTKYLPEISFGGHQECFSVDFSDQIII